jgi:hypothetical protein
MWIAASYEAYMSNLGYAKIAGVILVLAVLVALIGYPLVICLAVLASWLVLIVMVIFSAGDLLERRTPPAPGQKEPVGATKS